MGARQSSPSPSTDLSISTNSPPSLQISQQQQHLPSSSSDNNSSCWTLLSSPSSACCSCSLSESTRRRVVESFSIRCDNRGKLRRDAFNEALEVLEDVGLRRLRGTPLGHRLFDLFDVDMSGEIDEKEFIDGVVGDLMACSSCCCDVAVGGEENKKRILLSYRAYDMRNKGFVSTQDIIGICSDIWITAFRLLADKLPSPPPPSLISSSRTYQTIIDFSVYHLENLQAAVYQSLEQHNIKSQMCSDTTCVGTAKISEADNTTSGLSLEDFGRWASVDRTIEAAWGRLKVQVAVTFFNIDKPVIQ
eukprot:GHVS01027435.1.p1 GENE.GHVS01027435.1~~GHVS01027435.1.p1  ORF type:complete len:304 (+),score=72.72 GHVS01027435.1:388-1299(+)